MFTCLVSQWSAANQQPGKILFDFFSFFFFNLWFWIRKYCPVVMKKINKTNGHCFRRFLARVSSSLEPLTVTAQSKNPNSKQSFSPGLFSVVRSKFPLHFFGCNLYLSTVVFDGAHSHSLWLAHSLALFTHFLAVTHWWDSVPEHRYFYPSLGGWRGVGG